MRRALPSLRRSIAIAVVTWCLTGCSAEKPKTPEPGAAAAHPERTLAVWSDRLGFAAAERDAVANAVDLYLTRVGLVAKDLGMHDPISAVSLHTNADQLTDRVRDDLKEALSGPELARFDQTRDAFRAQALEDLINTLVFQARHAGGRGQDDHRDDMHDAQPQGGRRGGRGGGGGRVALTAAE